MFVCLCLLVCRSARVCICSKEVFLEEESAFKDDPPNRQIGPFVDLDGEEILFCYVIFCVVSLAQSAGQSRAEPVLASVWPGPPNRKGLGTKYFICSRPPEQRT